MIDNRTVHHAAGMETTLEQLASALESLPLNKRFMVRSCAPS